MVVSELLTRLERTGQVGVSKPSDILVWSSPFNLDPDTSSFYLKLPLYTPACGPRFP